MTDTLNDYTKLEAGEFLKAVGTDAKLWADAFMQIWGKKLQEIDHGLMIGWFANAIMAQYDADRCHEIPGSESTFDNWCASVKDCGYEVQPNSPTARQRKLGWDAAISACTRPQSDRHSEIPDNEDTLLLEARNAFCATGATYDATLRQGLKNVIRAFGPYLKREASCDKCDAEMLRVKMCEHIAEGEEGWNTSENRNICPSTMAVADLRDKYEIMREVLVMLSKRQIATWYTKDDGYTTGYYDGWDDAEYAVQKALLGENWKLPPTKIEGQKP